MNSILRIGLSLCLIATLSVSIAHTHPNVFRELGLDVFNLPHLCKEIHKQALRNKKLQQERLAINERFEKREQVLKDLIRGESTLDESIEEIQELFPEELLNEICANLNIKDEDPDERTGRLILYWLRGLQSDNPSSNIKLVLVRAEMQLTED